MQQEPGGESTGVGKSVLLWSFLVLMVLGTTELASLLATKFFLVKKEITYRPEDLIAVLNEEKYAKYLENRHPVLGWPGPRGLRSRRQDESGARFSPAYPTPGNACISLFGDSFTWSDEVTDESAWGNVLSELIGCRVANYGYSGYGTDQAFMRFKFIRDNEASVAILAHMSGDIVRNLSQWRMFTKFPPDLNGLFEVKPRFKLDEHGDLLEIPLPTLSLQQFEQAIYDPTRFFPHDYFVPGSRGGVGIAKFPYSINAWRTYRSAHVSLNNRKEDWLESFYEPDHPSNGYRLTREILAEFAAEAGRRSIIPIVFLIPHRAEINVFLSSGRWIIEPLESELRERGLNVVNIGERMVGRVGTENLCDLFLRPRCNGHFNERGYQILAEIASDVLVQLDLEFSAEAAQGHSPIFDADTVIEAEHGALLNGRAGGEVLEDGGQPPVKYVKNGHLYYRIRVAEEGEYVLSARVIADSGKTDSYFLSVDGDVHKAWHVRPLAPSWEWRDSSFTWPLEPGVHSLEIERREPARIDKVVLKKVERDQGPQ